MNKAALIIFLGVKTTLETFGQWLMSFGVLGLFSITLLDSAFVPMPSGPDLVMITLCVTNPEWMPLYAMGATLGSTTGCTLMYLAARKAGMRALRRISVERRDRIENLLGRHDMLALIIPSVLPPPFPFKAFVLCAGVFKLQMTRFVIAIFIGRGIRYTAEGLLAVQFGEEAWPLIKQHGLKVFIVIGVIFVVSLAFKFYRLRSRKSQPLAVDEIQD